MMYADVDVRMGRGGQPDADKSGQGGGLKSPNFCGRPLWMTPYLFCSCNADTANSAKPQASELGVWVKYGKGQYSLFQFLKYNT